MEEVMKPFVELLSEESENAEVLDLGCGSGRDTLLLEPSSKLYSVCTCKCVNPIGFPPISCTK